MTLTAQTPPDIKLEKIPGGYKYSTIGKSGYLYYSEHSTDGKNWTFISTLKLGNGNRVEWTFAAPEPNIPRNFYRARESLTGGYTATTAAALDSDADGLTDVQELDTCHTNPFVRDTDSDGMLDGEEVNANLNPNIPDDSSPGVFVVHWQRTDSASLAPQGWQSLTTSITPAKPNYYRSITAEAIEKKSSATSGSEFNTGKTMTIQRVLQTQTPLRYDTGGSGFFPVYQEQATYSFTVGQSFVAITSHLDPASWGTPSPGAFAKRDKWPGQSIYDYGWTYAAPVSNQTVQGDFKHVNVPVEVTGDAHTWVNPAVAQGGNRYKKQSLAIGLPNRNFPSNGNVLPNSNWATADSASSDETTEGIKTQWTLGNRWTYADVRSELDRLRSSLHSVYEAVGDSVSQLGLAVRRQSAEGDAQVDTYEFRFQKIGGGVGATTLVWPEVFTPSDNPETTTDESTGAIITKIRRMTLPANTNQSAIFKLDPRNSPWTSLPGDSSSTPLFGSTVVNAPPPVVGELKIYSGQSSQPVPKADKETIGAFTVANLNDTNANGVADNDPNELQVLSSPGNDIDLMKLVISGPSTGRMKVTVTGGTVNFWRQNIKGTKIPVSGGAFFIDAADLPKTVWVEAPSVSASIRDIKIKLGWEKPDGTLLDDLDRVTATAVWVEPISSGVVTSGTQLPSGADGAAIIQTFKDFLGGHFGVQVNTTPKIVDYCIGLKFEVKPTGVGAESGVIFDISRQRESITWLQDPGGWLPPSKESFPAGDVPNDDDRNVDEDNIPKNDSIFSIDNPGINYGGYAGMQIYRVVKKGNFKEFVRIKFDGKPFASQNGALQGSRCSPFTLWNSRGDIYSPGNSWSLSSPPAQNSVTVGNSPLGTSHP